MTPLEKIRSMKMPFAELKGVNFTEAEKDRVVAAMLVRPDLCTLNHTIHGGALMMGNEGMVMLYTPRTLAELDTIFQLIVDSYNYVTGRSVAWPPVRSVAPITTPPGMLPPSSRHIVKMRMVSSWIGMTSVNPTVEMLMASTGIRDEAAEGRRAAEQDAGRVRSAAGGGASFARSGQRGTG